ncbi:MAG: AEC family transporter [Eggerthellaceae bacterium]|jgi:predicted permease
MNSLSVAVASVTPFLIYMGLGWLMRRLGWVDVLFLRRLNTVSFKAFFPPMMFYCIYQLEGRDLQINWLFIACALIALAVVVAGLLLIVPRLEPEDSKRGVIIQAIYRTNIVFFAMPLTESVFGAGSLVPSALLVSIVVPTYNVLAVIILEYYHGTSPSPGRLALSVVKNPLILGFLTGFAFYFLQIRLPECIESPVIALANLAIPLALIALGGTIRLNETKANMHYLVPVLTVKMAVLPAISLIVFSVLPLGLAPVERFLLLVMFAAPIASASYPMAENMGGDGTLAGELVAVSSGVSIITLFLWVLIFTSLVPI